MPEHSEHDERGKHAHRPDGGAVPFGFETVAAGEKAGRVRQVFESVAPRYDLMNDLMSGGLHRLWKAALVDALAPRPGMRLVDVAGGTGDIAFRVQDRVRKRWPDETIAITIADINPAMLAGGKDRAVDMNRRAGLTWVCGDAEALPLPDRSFDAYTIAFGIRNVTDRARALSEARRVLKPGGRFLCLEFSTLRLGLLQRLYDAYSFGVIPALGGLVTGDRDAYRYLVESIRRFPGPAAFTREISAAGFARVQARPMSGGVVALHAGWRI